MANMSYCRFRNTANDLDDCLDALANMEDFRKELPPEELRAALNLIKLCRMLADDYGDEQ